MALSILDEPVMVVVPVEEDVEYPIIFPSMIYAPPGRVVLLI
jgi:hypothetical protein